jgi:ABC-type multidrug transport system fused ATPase/permease subunit
MTPIICPPKQPFAFPNRLELQLSDVSFHYSDQQNWALKKISLTIPQGSKIAIVAANGSDKTTLLHLLMRYL